MGMGTGQGLIRFTNMFERAAEPVFKRRFRTSSCFMHFKLLISEPYRLTCDPASGENKIERLDNINLVSVFMLDHVSQIFPQVPHDVLDRKKKRVEQRYQRSNCVKYCPISSF